MLVWGCCWFNEEVDCVINFINNSLNSLKLNNFNTIPVVFVANTTISDETILKLTNSINDVKVIRNKYDLYPNKNYGVYSIVSYAHKISASNVAIVDPDWNILNFNNYVSTAILPLLNNEVDIIIPNIGDASGRSNILIGKTAIELFYNEYSSNIKSAFPGAVFGSTEALYTIVSSPDYHFDWGGEWDLISLAIDNNYRLLSKNVNVINVRHRNNNSKIKDSFQIWRAILSNSNIKDKYSNSKVKKIDHRLVDILSCCNNIDEIINMLEQLELSKTEKQLLYMLLYPIKSIIDGKEYTFTITDDSSEPYNKDEIYDVYELGLFCINIALKDIDLINIINNAKTMDGGLFGPWTKENIKDAKENINKQIERYL